MKILFTIAAHVDDRPNRWQHVCKTYQRLALSLSALGHEAVFYVHDDAYVEKSLKSMRYALSSQCDLEAYLEQEQPDVVFIWGGRISADHETVAKIRAYRADTKIIYSELGWFPQRDTIYFDEGGTNANASFSKQQTEYTPTQADLDAFHKMRNKIVFADLGLPFYRRPAPFHIAPPDISKKILVPLQDETDTNITESSPFQKMGDFVTFLSETYPSYEFLVRPHPRAPIDGLPRFSNVEYQDSAASLFGSFNDIGMVLGINSTVLLQSALHNKTVVAVGQGIASYGGCVYNMDVNNPLAQFDEPLVNQEAAVHRLTFLLVQRQLQQGLLHKPHYIQQSYLYDMLQK